MNAMDMEMEYFIKDMESKNANRRRDGFRAPGRLSPANLTDTIPDVSVTGVASELTGAIPASLGHGEEIVDYGELFPKL